MPRPEPREGDVALPLIYRWRRVLGGALRIGQPCRVVARGALGSVLVEFADGWRTSRRAVRRG